MLIHMSRWAGIGAQQVRLAPVLTEASPTTDETQARIELLTVGQLCAKLEVLTISRGSISSHSLPELYGLINNCLYNVFPLRRPFFRACTNRTEECSDLLATPHSRSLVWKRGLWGKMWHRPTSQIHVAFYPKHGKYLKTSNCYDMFECKV